jgi:hypothetical protein
MYRLTAQYAGYPKIHELREEIKLALPKTQSRNPRARGGNSAQA